MLFAPQWHSLFIHAFSASLFGEMGFSPKKGDAMRSSLLYLLPSILALATPASADHWHHRHNGFEWGWGGYYHPYPPHHSWPNPWYYGNNYRWYYNWGGTYQYVYCSPEQGWLAIDAYGNYVCVRPW